MTDTVPRLHAPIFLVHGLMGYDKLSVGPWTLADYFPGIPGLLQSGGNRVLSARLSPTAGIASRAAQLARAIERLSPDQPVHIIAHSMGGLDARYMVSRLGMASRVLTLTTIGTPHRGTAFADWGIRRLERVLRPFLNLLDIPDQAFYDLTTARCREFNEQAPDVPGVRYFSVAGHYDPCPLSPQMQLCHRIVYDAEGHNDGLVSITSATYGEGAQVWKGDHLSLVNWPANLWNRQPPKERLSDYAGLIQRLAEQGF